jgi:amidase
MDDIKLDELTLQKISQGLSQGEFTVVDIVQAHLLRIQAVDEIVHAVLSINPDALNVAKQLDEELDAGRRR